MTVGIWMNVIYDRILLNKMFALGPRLLLARVLWTLINRCWKLSQQLLFFSLNVIQSGMKWKILSVYSLFAVVDVKVFLFEKLMYIDAAQYDVMFACSKVCWKREGAWKVCWHSKPLWGLRINLSGSKNDCRDGKSSWEMERKFFKKDEKRKKNLFTKQNVEVLYRLIAKVFFDVATTTKKKWEKGKNELWFLMLKAKMMNGLFENKICST